MTDGQTAQIIEAETVAATAQPASNPQIEITAQELMYLYTILLNSNVPSRDAAFVAQLQTKLQAVLNINPPS